MSGVARSAALLGFALACVAPLALAAESLPLAPAKLEAGVQTLIPGLDTLHVGVRAMSYALRNLLQLR